MAAKGETVETVKSGWRHPLQPTSLHAVTAILFTSRITQPLSISNISPGPHTVEQKCNPMMLLLAVKGSRLVERRNDMQCVLTECRQDAIQHWLEVIVWALPWRWPVMSMRTERLIIETQTHMHDCSTASKVRLPHMGLWLFCSVHGCMKQNRMCLQVCRSVFPSSVDVVDSLPIRMLP